VARAVGKSWETVRVCLYELALLNKIDAFYEVARWRFFKKRTYPA